MLRAFKSLNATACLAGLRSAQTSHRASLTRVHRSRGMIKVLPILNWSEQEVAKYFKKHSLPPHPLSTKGYVSVGDTHSSRPVSSTDKTSRATRFKGKHSECGMHLDENVDLLQETAQQKKERLLSETNAKNIAAKSEKSSSDSSSNVVELYTKPSCRYCKAVKEHLKKRKIKYIDHTVKKRADWGALQHRAMKCCSASIKKAGKPRKLLVLVPHVFVNGKWLAHTESQRILSA